MVKNPRSSTGEDGITYVGLVEELKRELKNRRKKKYGGI